MHSLNDRAEDLILVKADKKENKNLFSCNIYKPACIFVLSLETRWNVDVEWR
jgi:hypothetical protein